LFDDSDTLQIVVLHEYIIIYTVSIVLVVIFVLGDTYDCFSGVSSGENVLPA